MEILEFLARLNASFVVVKKDNGSVFVNQTLSEKLMKQTEDPLFLAGGVMPEWCLTIPSLTPNMYVLTNICTFIRAIYAPGISHFYYVPIHEQL